jgi:hypothetical protein
MSLLKHHDSPRLTWIASALLVLVSAVSLAGPASAGKNPNAKFLLHLVPYSTKNTCETGVVRSFDKVVTRGDLFPAKYTAYVLVVDGSNAGISGVQFGIAFNDSLEKGVDIIDWQECSLFNWPMQGWPTESMTGNLCTWNQETDCDTSGVRVAGYFYLTAHSRDRLQIIARPVDNKAAVAACGIRTDSRTEVLDLIHSDNMGFVEFGGGEGYNPWDPKQNLGRFRKSKSR